MKQKRKYKNLNGIKRNSLRPKSKLKNNSLQNDVIIEDTLEQRLIRAIEKNKAISELIIGYVPYTISFLVQELNGTTNKPAKISAFEKAIVGIINIDGQSSFSSIGKIMGLDIMHDLAEEKMLRNAIDSMIRYKLIDGDDASYFITEQGKEFAAHGERMSTFSADFELWYLNKNPDFTSLRDCISSLDEAILIDQDDMFPEGEKIHNLSFEEIKNLSEAQASNMQSSKERFILQSATVKSTSFYKYEFTVCFVQSIRNRVVRPLVYDDNAQKIIPSLSELIDKNDDLKQSLFNCMLQIASENTEMSVFDDINVAHAQVDKNDLAVVNAAEKKLLAQEDGSTDNITNEGARTSDIDLSERLHKKALYDSIAFEAEIHSIFQNDNPDEIWLSSPWIKDYTFMNNRLPLIENYLNKGGKVFVSYSAPDGGLNTNREMVEEKSRKSLSKLEKKFPKQFFHVELPAFHKKNVIEVKNGQCVLFTGSFNVLSFSVTSQNVKHVRAEEMCLAHYQAAINQYNETKRNFAKVYISKAKEELSNLNAEQIAKYNNTKLLYFRKDDNLAELFIDFDNAFEEREIQVKNNFLFVRKANNDGELPNSKSEHSVYLRKALKYYNEGPNSEDTLFNYIISLYYLTLFDNPEDAGIGDNWKIQLQYLLLDNKWNGLFIYGMSKDTLNGNSKIHIVIQDYLFDFSNVTLKSDIYFKLAKNKKFLKFSEYKNARISIDQLIKNL